MLASLPSFGDRALQPLHLPSADQLALSRLTKQRVRYREAISATKRRLLELIRWAQPALERALPDLTTAVSLSVLEHYFDPHRLRRLGARRLANFLGRHVAGTHTVRGKTADDLARDLVQAAAETLALYGRDGVDFDRLQLEVRQEVRLLHLNREHMRELEQEIERLYERLHPEDLLRTLPGTGNALGPSLLGVLHNWRRFRGGRRMRGSCGLFPKRNESGGAARPRQRITQGGNNRVKRDLILAADVARTVDPELAAVCYRCMVGKGHHHRQALCAVATRLVNRIYAVWRDGRPYVLRDLQGKPMTTSEAKASIQERFQVREVVRRAQRRNLTEVA